jgi:membrane-associated protease RseP (regulator of RpoE activity)
MTVDVSPEVLKVIAEAESRRAENAGASSPEVQKKVTDSIGRIVEQARKLSESGKEESTAGEAAVRKEFENLLTVLTSPRGMSQEAIKYVLQIHRSFAIDFYFIFPVASNLFQTFFFHLFFINREFKDKVFGPNTFWVTETDAVPGIEDSLVVRGNFRGPKEKVFAEICEGVQKLHGDKYIVRLVEEREWEGMDPMSEPRIILQIIPMEYAMPPPTAGWQRGAAAVTLALTLASALQLGLAANVGLLPKETLQWLANPANLNSEMLPPGLETFDPVPWVQSALAVGGAALLPQLAHEVGHAVTAGMKGIKLGPSFLIPNSQLGTFGSITQLKSLVKNRTDLFDFALSGLGAGFITSLVMFITGLLASHAGGGAEAGLLPVPSALFQGSLMLGGLAKLALGADAMAKTTVFVSPLMVGGWCGLVATALNGLPVGNLDGGRVMLAAYGRDVLAFASLISYIGLGLGLLGSSLSLPFGLYVLICQREAEKNLQDEVNGVSENRKVVALGMAALAILVLLPAFPDATELALMGGDFL